MKASFFYISSQCKLMTLAGVSNFPLVIKQNKNCLLSQKRKEKGILLEVSIFYI